MDATSGGRTSERRSLRARYWNYAFERSCRRKGRGVKAIWQIPTRKRVLMRHSDLLQVISYAPMKAVALVRFPGGALTLHGAIRNDFTSGAEQRSSAAAAVPTLGPTHP